MKSANRTLQPSKKRPTPKNIEEKAPVSAPNELNSYSVKFGRKAANDAPKGLTPHQLEDLLAVIESKRDQTMFRIIYTKGLRASEAGLLQMRDWDDRAAILYV